MQKELKVVGFFKTSIGTIVVVELPTYDVFLDTGMILNNEGRSRWKIVGAGMGKKPNSKEIDNSWMLTKDYKVEHISGETLLKEGDLVYIRMISRSPKPMLMWQRLFQCYRKTPALWCLVR